MSYVKSCPKSESISIVSTIFYLSSTRFCCLYPTAAGLSLQAARLRLPWSVLCGVCGHWWLRVPWRWLHSCEVSKFWNFQDCFCSLFFLRFTSSVVFWNYAFWICTCDANLRPHTHMICVKTHTHTVYIHIYLQGPFARHDSLPCHYSYENLQG